ncbi:hypothetical protein BDV96DRAFT_650883 [Lophiotrema nucula]|uniref:F-box domain-containing protein n=1 Tax=Lophiotrema nucula TaxID=690887 RepID=A0A6A5YUV7_9PLEO|nr:hypothetical protein BDV96DRAFT_650883 [Lophiotrema nucula]
MRLLTLLSALAAFTTLTLAIAVPEDDPSDSLIVIPLSDSTNPNSKIFQSGTAAEVHSVGAKGEHYTEYLGNNHDHNCRGTETNIQEINVYKGCGCYLYMHGICSYKDRVGTFTAPGDKDSGYKKVNNPSKGKRSAANLPVPRVPDDILHYLVPFIESDADLRNYRLVNKVCAESGAKELFRAVKFHASRASVERIKQIAASDTLRKHVRTIVWDSNIWKHDRCTTLGSYVAYVCSRYRVDNLVEDGEDLFDDNMLDYLPCIREGTLGELIGNVRKKLGMGPNEVFSGEQWKAFKQTVRTHHDAYTKLFREEQIVEKRGLCTRESFARLLEPLRNLSEIMVCNGQFQFTNQQYQNRWTISPPVVAGLLALRQVNLSFFREHLPILPNRFEEHNQRLTSLTLDILVWWNRISDHLITGSVKHSLIKDYLRSASNLRSLSLSFHFQDRHRITGERVDIADVVPPETWTKLEQLSLHRLATSEDDLACLLEDNSRTLTSLTLGSIQLMRRVPIAKAAGCAVPGWRELFERVKPSLKLKSAKVVGPLSDREMNLYGQETDEGPSLALAEWLVHGSGECPVPLLVHRQNDLMLLSNT